jgi:hypothetical protein
MSTVIPKWNAFNVAAWEELLVVGAEGNRNLNPATAMIINYMPIIGITVLTKENAVDAWLRMTLLECIHGSFLRMTGGPKDGHRYFVTKDDVERHIGLDTEGSSMTHSEFYARVCHGVSSSKIETSGTAAYIANGQRTLLEVGLGKSD